MLNSSTQFSYIIFKETMKKILLSTIIATTSLLGMSSIANAANVSSNINVSANLEKTCYFKTLRDVNFNYQPEAITEQNISSKSLIDIKCTLNANPTLSISGPNSGYSLITQRVLTGADNQTLNYTLEFHDGQGGSFGVYSGVIDDGAGSSILQQSGTTFNEFFMHFVFPKGQFVKPQVYSESITFTLSY